MELDDVIYITLLFVCIGIGYFYKQIKNIEQKKWLGTGLGILIILVAAGLHILHPLITFMVNSFIILGISNRKCHIVSFVFTFAYLLFFRSTIYFGIPNPPGHANLIQMVLTLKLVGLAFERNTIYIKSEGMLKKNDDTDRKLLTDAEYEILNLNFIDIFHYSFNYIAILTGPYFSYRTFRDYLYLPFSENADSIKATLNKLKLIPLFASLFLLASYIWPLSYATNPEFYETRSFFYRLMYVWPTFFIFRMRIYTGVTLSECVCTMAGFGAYPTLVESTPGAGPKKDYISMAKNAGELEYDFETIHNVDAYTTDTCWTFREAMKSWNMCIQYWLAVNIYKRFPNKKYRTLATLAVSAFWHGVYSGYYLCMLGAPFYLPIEDLYHKLYRQDAIGIKRRIIDIVFWLSKFFAFSYMGIAFLLLSLDKIWFYYNSIYHVGYILWIAMYLAGIYLLKQRKQGNQKNDPKMTQNEKKKLLN